MRQHFAITLLVGLVAGCMVQPSSDPLPAAQRAVKSGQLLRGLAYVDFVPVAHPRYPDAQVLREQILARIRRSQDSLLRGLELHATGDDPAAIRAFVAARKSWPDVVGARSWEEACRHRLLAQGKAKVDAAPVAAAPVLEPAPVEQRLQTRAATNDVDPAELASIRAQLATGEVNEGMRRLLALQRAHPTDRSLLTLLLRVLDQRALLDYGRGNLQAAESLWSAAHELDPEDESVLKRLTAVRAERVVSAR